MASTNLNAKIAKLQDAASDLVRETSFKDKDGSEHAYTEVTKAYGAVKAKVKAKAPDEASEIAGERMDVREALDAGDFKKAATAAKELLDAVNDAASKVTGIGGGPQKGLVLVMSNMKSAARDLDQEVRNKDASGTERAYGAFKKLFEASKDKIRAKSAKAYRRINRAFAAVTKRVGENDLGKLRVRTKALVQAVNAAVNLVVQK